MPTFTEIVTLATTFVADYKVLIFAGAVISILGFAVRRLIKAGR